VKRGAGAGAVIRGAGAGVVTRGATGGGDDGIIRGATCGLFVTPAGGNVAFGNVFVTLGPFGSEFVTLGPFGSVFVTVGAGGSVLIIFGCVIVAFGGGFVALGNGFTGTTVGGTLSTILLFGKSAFGRGFESVDFGPPIPGPVDLGAAGVSGRDKGVGSVFGNGLDGLTVGPSFGRASISALNGSVRTCELRGAAAALADSTTCRLTAMSRVCCTAAC
jgi:hypothetical protein